MKKYKVKFRKMSVFNATNKFAFGSNFCATSNFLLLGPLTSSYVPTMFCYVYQVLSRFTTVKRERCVLFELVCAHGIK